MPPKVKITKEEIVKTAVDLVREHGEQAINARNIASALNCSTQPIFSNFATMDDLRKATINEVEKIYNSFMDKEIEKAIYPVYKAGGMAYIRFAKEERELFKLLFMRDRSNENEDLGIGLWNRMIDITHSSTGLDKSKSELFHLAMWVYVHGIATMFATGYLDIEWNIIANMVTDSYQGMRKQYGIGE